MPDKYKYSVVIPTRNRQRYCIEAIKTVTRLQRKDIEIIIPDSSDDQSLKQQLEDNDLIDMVTYLPPDGGSLSMEDNWERAIEHLSGEWVIYIGDDDGFTTNSFDVFDHLTETFNIKAFIWPRTFYKWPCYPTEVAGQLKYSIAAYGLTATFLDARKYVNDAFEWKTDGKWPDLGPSVYHGLIHASIITELKGQNGKYFVGECSDYSSAILNASRINYFMHYNMPLTIMGASTRSNTALLTGISPTKYKQEVSRVYTHNIKKLQNSGLGVPVVAESFKKIFKCLGRDFSLANDKLVTSCMHELDNIRNPDTFKKAQKALTVFVKKNPQLASKVQQMVCTPEPAPRGYSKNTDTIQIDTRLIGISGILEVTKLIDAMEEPFKSDDRHQTVVNMIKQKRSEFVK